jgi:hypothetical protein
MEKNLLDKPKIRIKTGGLQGASETGRQDGLEVCICIQIDELYFYSIALNKKSIIKIYKLFLFSSP